ncbi:hypothetical protein K445DRAFT_156703 [Daldinia sp. EC12]|nr:hypothetical protein K445DRAFT_156703 [Daldinia sp. EC12]
MYCATSGTLATLRCRCRTRPVVTIASQVIYALLKFVQNRHAQRTTQERTHKADYFTLTNKLALSFLNVVVDMETLLFDALFYQSELTEAKPTPADEHSLE